MNKAFYPKLALNNIRKNSKAYLPYILTCIGTIMMFYNMCYLVVVKDIGYLSDSGSLRYMLFLGAIIIGVFSAIFLFYTNSFLIKQRKKEFGLFNILGMEKRHIIKIMFFETIFTAIISLVVGILGGILLSKLMALLLFRLIHFEVVFGFEIPLIAVVITIVLFSVIFIINLIYNVFQVHQSKPIELLKGGNVGEREPKTKWFSTIIGVVSLGIGYYLALTIKSPIAALSMFFVAVMFVILGTHNLFKAGSIALLKSLRKNKNYYYKTNHFISVSGMIYRMKQNAAGLANICILSTAVIITLSTTVSLYVGMEDVLRTRFPRNIEISGSDISDEEANKIDAIIKEQTTKANIVQENVNHNRSIGFVTSQDGANFIKMNDENYSSNKLALLVFSTLEDYNEMENKEVSLKEGEALIYTLRGDIPGDKIVLNNYELNIKERLDAFEVERIEYLSNSYYVVVDSLNTIEQVYRALEGKDDMPEMSYYYGFDVNGDSDTQINLTTNLQDAVSNLGLGLRVEGAEISKAEFYTLYGGLFFLGLFIGLLFIMATVIIIYYKQIAEGYDDKARFEIMQKVGMSHREIKKSIHSQVLTVFYLPLITAIIHIAFAFNVVTKMLSVFNLTNISLYAICTAVTIIVFAFFYTIIYTLTARTYYKIVR